MARGTFANVRIINKLLGEKVGPNTVHLLPNKQFKYMMMPHFM